VESRIQELEKRINDIRKRLPAHSVKPQLIQELDDLEEELDGLKDKIVREAGSVSGNGAIEL